MRFYNIYKYCLYENELYECEDEDSDEDKELFNNNRFLNPEFLFDMRVCMSIISAMHRSDKIKIEDIINNKIMDIEKQYKK